MSQTIRLFAPAKINLGLSVLSRRPDGYHDLSTLMAPLSVGDELEVTAAAELSLEVLGAELPTDRRNLVYRAAEAYLRSAGQPGGAHITLRKRLPLASGLGGGSSDAASTLLALARLYPAPFYSVPGNLPDLARSLGADVPFFLPGGAALAEGTGERLTAVDAPGVWLLLLNPGVAISAADAYRWLDETGGYTPPLNLNAVLLALRSGEPVPYFNALQPGALSRHPEVSAALAALTQTGLHSPLMSGSGSTVFALARDETQARAAQAQIQAQFPAWWTAAARMIGPGEGGRGA